MRCLVVSWHSTAGHASTTNQSMGAQVPLHSLGCTTLSLTHLLTHSLTAYKEWKDGGGRGGKGVSPPHHGPFTFTMMMMVELLLLLQLWLLWLWMAIPMFIFLHTHTCMLACLQGGKGSVGNWYTVVSYGCTKLPTFSWEGRGVL